MRGQIHISFNLEFIKFLYYTPLSKPLGSVAWRPSFARGFLKSQVEHTLDSFVCVYLVVTLLYLAGRSQITSKVPSC